MVWEWRGVAVTGIKQQKAGVQGSNWIWSYSEEPIPGDGGKEKGRGDWLRKSFGPSACSYVFLWSAHIYYTIPFLLYSTNKLPEDFVKNPDFDVVGLARGVHFQQALAQASAEDRK